MGDCFSLSQTLFEHAGLKMFVIFFIVVVVVAF